ncbi:MAG: hypothetical protein KKC14_11100 [Alphaproteobacteria bacterium]|nr:hypothetical protein [Alphaproteobacteria bacterium]
MFNLIERSAIVAPDGEKCLPARQQDCGPKKHAFARNPRSSVLLAMALFSAMALELNE